MRVVRAATAEQTTVQAARFIVQALRAAVVERGRALLALSRRPDLYEQLTLQPNDWKAVQVFQVDERMAPAGHPDRNLTSLERALAESDGAKRRGRSAASCDLEPLPRVNLHAMPVTRDIEAGARDYERDLIAIAGDPPVLDVIHLGLGTNGHTASLFPGPSTRGSDAGRDSYVIGTGPHVGYARMSLTLPVLNVARQVVWLVTGKEKAEVLAQFVAGTLLAPAGEVCRDRAVVFADESALKREYR